MQNSSFSKIFSIALISLLLTQNDLASARTPQVQYPLAQLAQDGEIVMQLTGDAYRYIDSARVVHGEFSSRLRNDIRTILGPWRNGGRQLTLKADGSARTGFFNRIEGLQAGSPSVLVPLQLEVVSRTQSSSWFMQRTQSRQELSPGRYQTVYTPDIYQFGKPITEIPEAYDLRRPVPVDQNLDMCQSSGVYETCPNAFDTPPGGTTGAYVTPIYDIQPHSPAVIGSVLEITGVNSQEFNGHTFVVRLENITTGGTYDEVLTVGTPEQGKLFADLPNNQVLNGKLTITRLTDNWELTISDYNVIDPIVLAFDAFDAQAEGYSLPNAYLLSVVSQYVYKNTGEEDEYCDNQEDIFMAWGLKVRRCLDENGTKWDTDSQALILENDEALIIGFAGTQGETDFLTDAGALPIISSDWKNGLHKGFYTAHERLFNVILHEVNNANTIGKKVWLTGHSLGGAIAQITAFHLEEVHNLEVQGIITFGSPMVGMKPFPTKFNTRFHNRAQRWVNYNDPVPTLPGWPYQQTGTLVNITLTEQIVYDANDSEFHLGLDLHNYYMRHMEYFPILHNVFKETDFAKTFVYDFLELNGENDEVWNIWPVPEGIPSLPEDWLLN